MNNSLRRTLLLAAAGLIVWGGWYGWQSWKTHQALNALADVVRSSDLNKLLSDPPEEVRASVDLAVRGIRLSQGSKGRKIFELKADWATLNQDSGAITVRDPDILYAMGSAENGEPRMVHAFSRVGRVEDGNQKISMQDDVQAHYEKSILRGDVAVFLSKERTLSFPEGGELEGDVLSGNARHLEWNLDTNVLTGTNGVRMRWVPSSAAEEGQAMPDSAAKEEKEERDL